MILGPEGREAVHLCPRHGAVHPRPPRRSAAAAGDGHPVTAMVAGSMAPDVPLSLPWPVGYGGTHSLVGLLTVDLAVRIVAAAAWLLLLREPLVDSAPAAGAPAAGCAGPLLAASVGADTAGGWSSAGRPTCCGTASPTRTRAVRHVDSPGDQHGLFRGQEWAQYVSGVTGLLVVLVTGGVAVGGAVACHPEGLLAMSYSGAVAGVVALGAGIIALAAAWHLRTLCVRETGVTVDTVCARRQDPTCLREHGGDLRASTVGRRHRRRP